MAKRYATLWSNSHANFQVSEFTRFTKKVKRNIPHIGIPGAMIIPEMGKVGSDPAVDKLAKSVCIWIKVHYTLSIRRSSSKGDAAMKALFNLLLALLLAASLSACAATGGGEMVKVKCPACGHEFNPPPVGP